MRYLYVAFLMLVILPMVVSANNGGTDCVTVVTANSSGLINKSYVNCATEPILYVNVTNTTNVTTVLNITNTTFTFNETTIARDILNWTVVYSQNVRMNSTIENLTGYINQLTAQDRILNEKVVALQPLNATLPVILSQLNSTAMERDNFRTDANNRWAYALIALVGGYIWGSNKKETEPLRRLEEKRRVGDEEAFAPTSLIDDAIKKKKVIEDNIEKSKNVKGEEAFKEG